jgi:methionyl-tRNA formyltransferase
MSPLSIIFCGSGEFGLPTLRALIESGYQILHVFTQPDRPAGRGRKLTPTPIGQFAIDQHLTVTRTADINAEPLPPADLVVVIAFGQKIAEHVTKHARLGAVNLHGSRLPKFRGAAPVQAAILAGEKITGNSIIRLAAKMDAGAVLGMSEISIGELETAGEVHDRLAADGAPLMIRVLEELATGRATETEQDHSRATLARKLSRESARIDWSRPAADIARQIRGLYPWPACHVKILDGDRALARATLVRARPIASSDPSSAGEITSSGTIAATDGAVEVVELQPEGGRVMSLASFRNGHPWKPGLRDESV